MANCPVKREPYNHDQGGAYSDAIDTESSRSGSRHFTEPYCQSGDYGGTIPGIVGEIACAIEMDEWIFSL